MVKFFILFLIAFILQPINWIVGFITRLLWFPPERSSDFIAFEEKDMTDKSLEEMYNESLDDMNIRSLKTCQDFGKFCSMLYWATGKEEFWNFVMSMVDIENKTLHRYPPEYVRESEWTFSGDQLSGFMGALAKRITTVGLTDNEKKNLSLIWENISFKGFPMLIPHYIKGKHFDRGFVWNPLFVWSSTSYIKLMTWCLLGYNITGKIKYLLIYHMVYILFFPNFLISSIDGNIFIGKYFAISANTSHSAMLDIASGYMLNKSYLYEFLMKRMFNKKKLYSTDCLSLYGKYFGELSKKEKTLLKNLVYSTSKKFEQNVEHDKTYVNLIFPPHKEEGFSKILAPEYRNSDYTDERLFIEKTWWWGNKKPNETLYDVIFPVGIFLN